MIYDKNHECMSRDDLEQLQIERLQETLLRVYQNVAFYRDIFDRNRINIENIKSVKDLSNLPFTTREDLSLSYPYGMFAVPLRDIVRIHSASGTIVKDIVVGYTANDISAWTSLIARILTAADVTEHDFVEVAYNYGISSAGLGFHYGAEKIGASVIPSSSENIKRRIMIMKDYKTTTLISTPGYALRLGNAMEEMNIRPQELNLKTGLFGGEPWSERLRNLIEGSLHIKAYDNYGLAELIGPGISFECPERNGLHINEDHFIAEVIDPGTLKTLDNGEEGELVFTTITKQGFPLIRYRTGDISAIVQGPCSCGRTLARMKRTALRTDDIIILDGLRFYPSQVDEIIRGIEGVAPHYLIILDRNRGTETMEIQVEAYAFDEMRELVGLKAVLQEEFETKLGIKPKITLVEPETIKRSDGRKQRRVIDKREK